MNAARTLGLGRTAILSKALSRPVVHRSLLGATRTITIESVPASSQVILNQQRLKRPSSPHFTIYQPQLTWVASIVNRMTGVGLSVGLYGFLIAYIAAPVAGLSFDSAGIVDLVHAAPEWLKYTGKAIVAFPFTFHAINGVRHLAWDMVKFTSVKAVYRTGYSVIAASVVSAIALVMI